MLPKPTIDWMAPGSNPAMGPGYVISAPAKIVSQPTVIAARSGTLRSRGGKYFKTPKYFIRFSSPTT